MYCSAHTLVYILYSKKHLKKSNNTPTTSFSNEQCQKSQIHIIYLCFKFLIIEFNKLETVKERVILKKIVKIWDTFFCLNLNPIKLLCAQ